MKAILYKMNNFLYRLLVQTIQLSDVVHLLIQLCHYPTNVWFVESLRLFVDEGDVNFHLSVAYSNDETRLVVISIIIDDASNI